MKAAIRCVLIDDDEDFLVLERNYLSKCASALDIVTFTGSVAALEFLYHNHVDVIVTDLRMPFVDGFQLTRMIRAVDTRVPIVVVSDSDLTDDSVTEAGATIFVPKRRARPELAEVVERITQEALPH